MPDPHRFDDLFAAFGPIRLRRFFGGEGIYAGDAMIGMVFGDTIYFKTNERTREPFLAETCEPFTFRKNGRTVVTGWFALPDRLYDEPDELAQWARAALDVARHAPPAEKKRPRPLDQSKARKPPKRPRA